MSKTKTFFGFSGLALATVACHPALDLKGISAGFIKCPPSQVVVGNEETNDGLREWDALYRDEEWHCVRPAFVRTATPWIGTECRRVSLDSGTPAEHETANTVSAWNLEPADTRGGTVSLPVGPPDK